MSERLRSPRAQSAIPRISRSDALSRVGDVDHPFDLRGCSFFVCEGSHEGAVPRLRLAALGREPGVPRPRDTLRGSSPVLKPLSLVLGRLGNSRVAVVSGDGFHRRRSASSRTEEHVSHSELAARRFGVLSPKLRVNSGW